MDETTPTPEEATPDEAAPDALSDIDALMDAPVAADDAPPPAPADLPLEVERFTIPGPVRLTPVRREDERGWFAETYNAAHFAEAVGRDVDFVQDNQSVSFKTGTLRGLHFQYPPFAQGKLVRVVAGAILDVVVDIRHGSPTFGQHVKVRLDAKTGDQLWVPEGFAHGFITTRANTMVAYKTTALYAPQAEGVLAWNDELLHIDWEFKKPMLSERDQRAPGLADLVTPFALNPPQRI